MRLIFIGSILWGALLSFPGSALADVFGNREFQELSDVVYRDLAITVDIHGGIYGGRPIDRFPGTVFDEEVVEMRGVVDFKVCPRWITWRGHPVVIPDICAGLVEKVDTLSLLEFKKKGRFYYGAFKGKDGVSRIDLSLDKRKAIREIAYDDFLVSATNPSVPYVISSGESMLSLVNRYLVYDDANGDGVIGSRGTLFSSLVSGPETKELNNVPVLL